jgi:hypothetical protein
MLIALAERLADLGQAQRSLAVAHRAVDAAEVLADKRDIPAGGAATLRRAEELARREHDLAGSRELRRGAVEPAARGGQATSVVGTLSR